MNKGILNYSDVIPEEVKEPMTVDKPYVIAPPEEFGDLDDL